MRQPIHRQLLFSVPGRTEIGSKAHDMSQTTRRTVQFVLKGGRRSWVQPSLLLYNNIPCREAMHAGNGLRTLLARWQCPNRATAQERKGILFPSSAAALSSGGSTMDIRFWSTPISAAGWLLWACNGLLRRRSCDRPLALFKLATVGAINRPGRALPGLSKLAALVLCTEVGVLISTSKGLATSDSPCAALCRVR